MTFLHFSDSGHISNITNKSAYTAQQFIQHPIPHHPTATSLVQLKHKHKLTAKTNASLIQLQVCMEHQKNAHHKDQNGNIIEAVEGFPGRALVSQAQLNYILSMPMQILQEEKRETLPHPASYQQWTAVRRGCGLRGVAQIPLVR